MMSMHKRGREYPSRLTLCGVEVAERNAPRFLTTADKHVNCKRCRKLLADQRVDNPNISCVSHDMSEGWMRANPELAGNVLREFFGKHPPDKWTLTIERAVHPGMWCSLVARRKSGSALTFD